MPAKSLLELIGNTPLLEITHLPAGSCRLFVKLENQNPAGSIKDRIGLAMIKKCSGFDMNILCYDPAYQNDAFVAAIQEVANAKGRA